MTPENQILSNYISVLEKTNQQLDFWYNPYGLMVSILTLLVALIAIGVAYALWIYSKEQRDRVSQFFTEQEKIIKEKIVGVEKIESKYNELIKEYEKKLKSTTRQGRKEIQKTIEELKKEKARIGTYIGPLTVSGSMSTVSSSFFPQGSGFYGLNREKSMICTQCGKNFSYYDDDSVLSSSISLVSFTDKYVYCSLCGAKNVPQ